MPLHQARVEPREAGAKLLLHLPSVVDGMPRVGDPILQNRPLLLLLGVLLRFGIREGADNDGIEQVHDDEEDAHHVHHNQQGPKKGGDFIDHRHIAVAQNRQHDESEGLAAADLKTPDAKLAVASRSLRFRFQEVDRDACALRVPFSGVSEKKPTAMFPQTPKIKPKLSGVFLAQRSSVRTTNGGNV